MSRPLAPTVTIHCGDWQRTFAAGHDVVIGRDVRADVRLVQPVVSRAHAVLRCVDGRWTLIDNDSMNGMFVDHQQVRSVDVGNEQVINFGTPDGPQLTFELGSAEPPDDRPTTPLRHQADKTTAVVELGRAPDNDIVIPDMLASHHHAVLASTPEGVQLADTGSMNGTFVNGRRIKQVLLQQNDVVTIGNVDLAFADGALIRRTAPAVKTGGLEVCGISVTLDPKRTLLDDISLSAKPGTLTAVIGPSGSGKSTLAKVISGSTRPNRGTVSFERHNLHAEYASLRGRIGLVPQDDIVHRQLTVSQALGYAAELRMPPDTSTQERRQLITLVLEELELTPHADTRVDKLSGGQRKRVSVALELLTGPSLLVLDEPTTGLDPALDQQVMRMLRQLADAGRVIVAVTHSLAHLEVCDQVLLLAPGGKIAFCGAPNDIAGAFESTDWADIFTDISADPDAARRRFLERSEPVAAPPVAPAPEMPAAASKPVHTSLWRQCTTVARRQVRLLVADRGYFLLLVLLPFIVGILPLTVAGHAGFSAPPAGSAAPLEPKHIVALLNFGAILMGIALTVRDLIGERPVFRREQAVGLSASAYLLAKIVVFSVAAVIQSAVLVLVVTAPLIGKHAPTGAVVLGSPTLELFVDVAATCVVAAILGLLVSALARSGDQVIILLAVTLTAQLVLAGGFIPVTNRALLDPIAWFTPARWGFAATASTVDLSRLVLGIARDSHWQHTASAWFFDVAMLAVLAVGYAAVVRWAIRLKAAK